MSAWLHRTTDLQQDDSLSQSVGTSAPSTIFQSNGIEFKSKFTRSFWNTPNDSTDRSSTNEVWVTWTNPTSGETAVGKVNELDERAIIVDLRREFVKKRRKQADEVIDPVTVKVHEKKNGEVLEEDAFLKQYFVPPEGRGEGPGQSKKTALFLTLPRPNVQQPQLPVVRNAIIVFLLIGSVPCCTFQVSGSKL